MLDIGRLWGRHPGMPDNEKEGLHAETQSDRIERELHEAVQIITYIRENKSEAKRRFLMDMILSMSPCPNPPHHVCVSRDR